LAFFILILPISCLRAQTPPEIEKLAGEVAERLAGTSAHHILIANESTCLLDEKSCAAFEEVFRLKMSISVPDMQFVRRNDLVGQLKKDGFISVDAYFEKVLEVEAPKTGAELLITESLHSTPESCELVIAVIHPAEGQKLADFKAKATLASLNPEAEPIALKDPATGISMIVPTGNQHNSPLFRPPMCKKCPQPPYPTKASEQGIRGSVTLIATISEAGTVEDISVLEGSDQSLILQAIKTVKDWQFKPAIGLDGKPFATRSVVLISYNLIGSRKCLGCRDRELWADTEHEGA
jgi:TonB family protein